MKPWDTVLRGGTAGVSRRDQRSVVAANFVQALAGVVCVLWAIGFVAFDAERFATIILLNVVGAAASVAGLWLTRRGYWRFSSAMGVATGLAVVVALGVMGGRQAGLHYYLFMVPPLAALVLPRDRRLELGVVTALSILFFALIALSDLGRGTMGLSASTLGHTEVVSMALTMLGLSGIAGLFRAGAERAEAAAEAEHARSERLLRNVLPASIADRLKDHDVTTQTDERAALAERFEDASVLFADLVGFTELSTRMPADQLVSLLNRIFSRFDDLTASAGLEKIKTIGDAYMVAGNLPVTVPDHCARVARLALAFVETVAAIARDTGHPLGVRVGIHAGPVVAGVIGKSKFIYDLWGDTVNTASRMESHGRTGSVHVSAAFRARLGDAFGFEERGPIDVKGKGPMETFFLLPPHDA